MSTVLENPPTATGKAGKPAGGTEAAPHAQTDGFHLVLDALKLNGIETIYGLPGMGQLMINAVRDGDPAVVQGVVLTIAVGFMVVNLVVDILYLLVNPRLRSASR
jgi:ABC-type antimicrobial peptide transport system permease subunit